MFGGYSLPVLHSAEFLIPTHRYHLQALRHLYVLAAEPRLLTPVDVDSNTPCYALIEVTYKVNSLEEWGPLRRWGRQLKALCQRRALLIVVVSSLGLWSACGGEEPNSTQVIEGSCSAHLNLMCALMSPWEQNTGQGEGTTKSLNSQLCDDWPSILFLKRKGFQRHRGGWSHPWFEKPSLNAAGMGNLAFVRGVWLMCLLGKVRFYGIYFVQAHLRQMMLIKGLKGISGEKRCSIDPLWLWQRVLHVQDIVYYSNVQISVEVCLTCTMLCWYIDGKYL